MYMLCQHIDMYICGTGNVVVGIKFTKDNGEFYMYIYICICAYGLSSSLPFAVSLFHCGTGNDNNFTRDNGEFKRR